VPLAFSSEEPYLRWFGYEILDHSPESVDLSRLNNSAPILSDHDHRVQIGVVVPGTAKIEPDKKGRLMARFGSSEKAKQEFQDVIDRIRTKVSVSYRVLEMVLDGEKDGIESYRVTKWQPDEVSLVSVPADDSVGVARNYENIPEIKIMKTKENKEIKDPVDVVAVESKARKEAEQRFSAIYQFRDKMAEKGVDVKELANEAIAKGYSFNDFRAKALDKAYAGEKTVSTNLDLTEKEKKNYSLFRALNAQATGNWNNAGFERECSLAIAERIGKAPNGIFVPLDIQMRSQNVGVPADGGYLVEEKYRPESFIDILNDKSVLVKLGARSMGGLIGDQAIPKKDGASTAYWVDEAGDVTDSDMSFDLIRMSPKTVGGAIPITRRMLKQGLPDVEALAIDDIATQLALAIDLAGLSGDGLSNNPVGVIEYPSVNTATVAAPGAPTWAEIVAFETAIGSDNALEGDFSFVTTSAVIGTLKTTKKDAGSGIFLMENGQSNGYNVVRKNSLAANTIILGKFSDVLIGSWGVLDVMLDDSTLAKSGGTVVRVFQDVDIQIRRPESFCINA
jgi:HK97 family phage major capsid protein